MELHEVDAALEWVRDQTVECQQALSALFGAAEEDDLDAVVLDDANRELDGALRAFDMAREKVAMLFGRRELQRARSS